MYLFQYYDLAADVLAENSHLTFKYLTPVNLQSFNFDLNEIKDASPELIDKIDEDIKAKNEF